MKITIDAQGDEMSEEIIFSDEDMENDNFVDITINGHTLSVSIDDIFPALIAFDAKRSRRLSREEVV